MWLWVVVIVSGICAFFSVYMAFLAFRLNDSGVFLFFGFGLFSGLFFILSSIQLAAGKSAFFRRISDKLSGQTKPVSFVPHRFLILVIAIAGAGILAAILVPIFFK